LQPRVHRNAAFLYQIIKMFWQKYGKINQKIIYYIILLELINSNVIHENWIHQLLEINEYASISFTPDILYYYPQYQKQFFLTFANVIQNDCILSWEEKLQQDSEEIKN